MTSDAPAAAAGPSAHAPPATAPVGDPNPPRPDATRFDDPRITAMGLLAETVDELHRKFEAQFAVHKLSPAEFEVLLRLARTPGGALRMTDLSTQTQLTTSGITRLVDRLERAQLVQRQACPTDRRGYHALITRAGLTRLDAVLPGHLELIDRWLTSRFTPQQFDMLIALLRMIRDEIRPDATAGAHPSADHLSTQQTAGRARHG